MLEVFSIELQDKTAKSEGQKSKALLRRPVAKLLSA